MIKVSIIIPVYGVEKYIKRCLESLINQTLKEIEIIIVNDGTKDNSMKICREYQSLDSRISIYEKENEGLGLTRNYGLKYAVGEYVAFLDSDDFIDIDFYEKLYNDAKKNNSDVCFTNYKIKKSDGTEFVSKRSNIPFEENVLDSKTVLYNIMQIPTKNQRRNFIGMSVWRSVYRKSLIDNNNILFCSERDFISEDIIFNIDFLSKASKVSFIKDTYYYYCENQQSLTHIYRKDRFEKHKILYNELKRKALELDDFENMEVGICNMFINNVRADIKNAFKYNSEKEAKKEVEKFINDSEVKYALKKKSKEDFRKNIFDFSMKYRLIFLLKLFCKIGN